MKNCFLLKEILTIFDQLNVLILTWFWNTTRPIQVTPSWMSLPWESLPWCKLIPYISKRFACSRKFISASAGDWFLCNLWSSLILLSISSNVRFAQLPFCVVDDAVPKNKELLKWIFASIFANLFQNWCKNTRLNVLRRRFAFLHTCWIVSRWYHAMFSEITEWRQIVVLASIVVKIPQNSL